MRVTLSIGALLLAACSSLDQFDVPLSAEATIPGTLSTIPGVSFPRGFPGGGEISQRIENQGVEPADVKSARLTAGTFRAVSEGGHLAYVKQIELFVQADGLPRKRLASAFEEAFASRPTSVTLALDDVELQPYVTAPAMEIVPEIELASRPSRDLTVAVDLTLHVDLTLVD